MGRDKMVNCIICQVGAPCGFLKAKGMDLNHITPPGSLSGMAARQDGIARAICDATDVFRRTGCLDHCETRVPGAVYASTCARPVGGDPQDFNGLLAVADGRAMGLTQFLFHRHRWKVNNVCCLQDLYVDLRACGTGLGRRLIEAIFVAADANGTPAVCGLTRNSTQPGVGCTTASDR
jgi:hypothetical protein